eukprot:CAMPEP_0177627564 /NCGR_PEP_ID=MMETSP0419_2-20121207/31271_1 /TAXON_ID=582737 /ORGANISM="Tetraselmis sp., Strain GSL018" /LENGTH=507 /DNA_ID=CAMNT_0019128727 /DNA_START=708 /DNA_END=2232 /DNA_ORIENTATION=+
MGGKFSLSMAVLVALVLITFYLLGETAEEYFCPVVKKLTEVLELAPNTAGVTFLAFGNGAPDVFSSLAAFLEGDGKIGLGAIVSAGSFVSAFVVGAVAIAAAPFAVYDGYVRDVLFYFGATALVFAVFSDGHVHLWEASGLAMYYVFFVIFVVRTDNLRHKSRPRACAGAAPAPDPQAAAQRHADPEDAQKASGPEARPQGEAPLSPAPTAAAQMDSQSPQDKARRLTVGSVLRSYVAQWRSQMQALSPPEQAAVLLIQPFTVARWLTIPDVRSHDRIQLALNTALSPLLILLFFNDFVDFSMPVAAFGGRALPLWSVVLLHSAVLSAVQWTITDWASKPAWMEALFLGMAFLCSIAWISIMAQELLSCLSTLGHIMSLSPSIMGVTVLAWGNSIGDLVADVALARSGAPVVALAGCYAGPMFNMLVGLGLSFIIKTVIMYPQPYGLHYSANISVSFGFLFVALLCSIVAVVLSGYRVTRPWGFCLVALYFAAMLTSLMVESNLMQV